MYRITYQSDQELRASIRRSLMLETAPLNQRLLMEGLDSGLLKDGVQFLVGATAEYGLGAVTLPAAGSGLAVGPTVETALDSLFTAESVASTVSAVKNIGSMTEDFGSMIKQAIDSYDPANLNNYYQALRQIVRKGLATLGKGSTKVIEEFAEKLKKVVGEIIQNITGAIKDGIKLVLPDATIGLTVAKLFEKLLNALANNAFTVASQIIKKSENLQSFLTDPEIAVNFFKDLFSQVIKLMREAATKIEEASWLEKTAAVAGVSVATLGTGAIPAAALATLGPSGLEAGADALESALPGMLKAIKTTLTVVIPAAFTMLGIYQILMKDEYKKPKKKEAKKENLIRVTPSHLRAIIRESLLLEQQEMQDIIVNSYEDVEIYNILANYALNNDIQGALVDPEIKPYVEKNEVGWISDEAGGWFENVGEYDEMPAPEGWDAQKAYKFLRDLEDAAWKVYDKQAKAAIASDPDREFLELLGDLWTSMIEPSDMPDIKWKEYKKYIRLKPPRSISHGVGEIHVTKEDMGNVSGDWEDFKDFLTTRAGGQLGRRKPYKRSPMPYYD